jgi:peptide-methionine (S)-S-oxide reductase
VRARTLGFALLALLLGDAATATDETPLAKATFAGGCFWCMEPPFDEIDGVVSTTSGYTGGTKPDPTYQEVSLGGTGHLEAMQIVYDPRKVSYERLLEVYWMNVDPFDPGGQFCDRGEQYTTAIFYHDQPQRQAAERSRQAIAGRFSHPIATAVRPAAAFYPAEEYHQDYYRKNPVRYKFYRYTCGRDKQLEKVWGRAGQR